MSWPEVRLNREVWESLLTDSRTSGAGIKATLSPGLTSTAPQLGCHPFGGQLPNKSCSPHTLQPQSRRLHPGLGLEQLQVTPL